MRLMQPNYAAPTTAAEAAKLLAQPDARLLAGGTDLIVQARIRARRPGLYVDVKHIPGLIGVTRSADGGFVIGAATPCAALGENADLKKAWPGVIEAAKLIGSTQVQGRASLGGNLCNASPAADSVPALVAAGARVVVEGKSGKREMRVEEIPAGPGRTSLAPGEFVSAIILPPRPKGGGDAYLRLIPRTEMDIAVVGAGVALTVDGAGTVIAARVALGAVAPTVRLVEAAGKALVGSTLDPAALAALEAAAEAACAPIDDKRGTIVYRTKVAGVLARRAAQIAYKRAVA
jgi:carbon-monoxide dehydrogenase medium subunit